MVANFDDTQKKNVKKAVALRYDQQTDPAPTLVAKGKNELAEKIIAIAEEHNIPITEDADLVEILEAVDLDEQIPLEVYAVVAEIFAYLYRVNKEKAKTNPKLKQKESVTP